LLVIDNKKGCQVNNVDIQYVSEYTAYFVGGTQPPNPHLSRKGYLKSFTT